MVNKLVHHHYSGELCKACIQKGREEVVEWVKKYRSESTREFICLTLLKETWQAKLKEWGL